MTRFLDRHWLGLALLVCAALHFAAPEMRRVRRADAAIAAQSEGSFPRDGEFPGEALRARGPLRHWGSWAGGDTNVGSLVLGPFPAPRRLQLTVSGYPREEGIELFVERVEGGERLAIPTPENPRESWALAELDLPRAWVGAAIRIVARDQARQGLGWVAISEPVHASAWHGLSALGAALGTWGWQGLLLGLVYRAASRWLAGHAWCAAHWRPLIAGAAVASAGWIVFWLFLFHPTAGKIASATAIAASTLVVLRRRNPTAAGAETANSDLGEADTHVPRLMFAIGLLYIVLLHLFSTWLDPFALSAHRFVPGLPGDNAISHQFASRVFEGMDPRATGSDWLSSDRPPLQSGWLLLTWPATKALGAHPEIASLTGGIWFQLWWVASAYGLLRTLGVTAARTRAWLAVMAMSGFLLQNTVYTWPKLGAAAFACGACAIWFLRDGPHRPADFVVGGALAGLAWVAHGGVAFGFVALAPWIIWRVCRGEAKGWLLAAAAFGLFAGPWTIYQRFYDPPGNRLLKWHLAGQPGIDARGTWQAIKEGYAALPLPEIARNKAANFRTQVQPAAWPSLLRADNASLAERHTNEFFHLGRALTWWPLAGVALLFGVLRRFPAKPARPHGALGAWLVATVVVWCLLMFGANTAVLHQGSYTVPLGALALGCACFELGGRAWIVVVAGLQGFTFVTTWVVGNHAINGHPIAWPVAVAAVTLLGAVAFARPPRRLDA